jgi:flagellar basal-body rod modification protein FlgD
MTATAMDYGGQSVAVSTQVLGTIDSVDLTQSPPLLSIGGESYTISQLKNIVK